MVRSLLRSQLLFELGCRGGHKLVFVVVSAAQHHDVLGFVLHVDYIGTPICYRHHEGSCGRLSTQPTSAVSFDITACKGSC